MARNVSTIYDDGDLTKTKETFHGKPFFRKLFFYSNPPKPLELYRVLAETTIVHMLMEHPHPNVVSYFRINHQYVDMEKVSIKVASLEDVLPDMLQAKVFLHSLGIMYMDWKLDNIGKSRKGYKLFDFDGSGIAVHGKWKLKPAPYWSFKEAIKQGLTDPLEMDNWSFHNCFNQNDTSLTA